MRLCNASMITMSLIAPVMAAPTKPKPMPGKCAPVNRLFLRALAKVEHEPNTKPPIRDNGKAVGCLQIWPIYVREANRILGFPAFNEKDRWDREACYEMTRIVLTHWSRHWARKGYNIGPAELCSMHLHQHDWSPKNLLTKKEEIRTKRLYKWLHHYSKKR